MKDESFNGNDQTQALDPQQWVNGSKLLEVLFPQECRPTVRWLRDQTKARRIPYVKIGRLVFFSPAQVRAALEANHTSPNRRAA